MPTSIPLIHSLDKEALHFRRAATGDSDWVVEAPSLACPFQLFQTASIEYRDLELPMHYS